jgi:hypothetical protein
MSCVLPTNSGDEVVTVARWLFSEATKLSADPSIDGRQ